MVIVVFEFYVNKDRENDYFLEVKKLQTELKNEKGFISVERFESNNTNGYFVSISTWKDEESVNMWHKNSKHVTAQNLGKQEIFKSFRIRVAKVLRDYNDKNPRSN